MRVCVSMPDPVPTLNVLHMPRPGSRETDMLNVLPKTPRRLKPSRYLPESSAAAGLIDAVLHFRVHLEQSPRLHLVCCCRLMSTSTCSCSSSLWLAAALLQALALAGQPCPPCPCGHYAPYLLL